MTSTVAGWVLLGFAVGLLLTGHPEASLVPAIAAGAAALVGGDPDAADARRRNRRIR